MVEEERVVVGSLRVGADEPAADESQQRRGGSARVVYDLDSGYSLTSVTAYRGYELDVLSDQDGAVSMGKRLIPDLDDTAT